MLLFLDNIDSRYEGDPVWWSKSDARLLEGMLALGIVLVAVFGVAAPLLGDAGTGLRPFGEGRAVMHVTAELKDPVRVPGAPVLPEREVFPGDREQVEMGGARTVEVTFFAPTTGQRLQYLLGPLLVAVTALVVLALLFFVARSQRLGEPFTLANARRVSAIGAVLAVGGTLAPFLTIVMHNALLESTAAAPLVRTNEFTLSFVWVAVGLVVASVGEVFRRGAALREDVDGLV